MSRPTIRVMTADDGARPAVLLHPDCGLHDTGWGHPEHQGRLRAIVEALERDSLVLLDAIVQLEPPYATEEALLRIHSPAHITAIRQACERAATERAVVSLDADTVVSPASWNAALAAAGGAITGAAMVAGGEVPSAFALGRPPGHHALPGRAMGFCLFNNVAIATRSLQVDHHVGRVLIVDWDVHHGNGTQDVFYDDPSVYYLSVHQSPWYPGTGYPDERGTGRGLGTTRNVALAAGASGASFLEQFEHALDAALAEFEPEFVLVSAGFDCMRADPLGGLLLEPRDLHVMTTRLIERALAFAGGRIVLTLEGGYAPERLGAGVVDVVRALAGLPPRD